VLTTSSFQPFADNQYQVYAGLMAALQGVPPLTQCNGGDDWVMDTDASSHMANNPDILTSSSTPPLNTSTIVGNATTLPVNHIGSSVLHTNLALLVIEPPQK
jgi:hypothetical protein